MGRGKSFTVAGVGLSVASRAGLALFAGVVFATTLALGAVHSVTLGAVALGAASALFLIARSGPLRASQGVWVFLALALVCLLQSVPIPEALCGALAPEVAEAWRQMHRLTGLKPTFYLSLDPAATRVESLKLVFYGAAWLLASHYAHRHGARPTARLIFALALSVLAASLLHRLAGARSVFGVYAPTYVSIHASPLLNANNESGLLNLGAFCGLGLFLSSKRAAAPSSILLVGVAALTGGSVLTGSRGGVVTLFFGFLLLLGWLIYRAHKHRSANYRPVAALASTVGFGAVVGALAASRRDIGNLLDHSVEKLRLFGWAWDVARLHPWTGAGRGALGSELGKVRTVASNSVFEFAENWPLDFIAGWGFVVGSAAVASLLGALRPVRLLRKTSHLHRAMYVGVVVLTLQNLVDLGFEVPGVALPAVVLLATLWGARHSATSIVLRARPGLASALATALLLGGGLLLIFPQSKSREVRRELANLARSKELSLDAVSKAVQTHPADAYLLRLGAVASFREKRGNALSWLNRSLVQDANNGRSYLLLSQLVSAQGGKRHAMLALRRAVSVDPRLADNAAGLAYRLSPEDVSVAVPDGAAGVGMLLALSRRAKGSELQLELARAVIERAPDSPDGYLRAASVQLNAMRDAPACDAAEDTCLADIRGLLAAAREKGVERLAWLPLHARQLALSGRGQQAHSLLLRECPREHRHRTCLSALLVIGSSQSDVDFRTAADAYLDGLCSNPSSCEVAQKRVAALFERRDDLGAALTLRRRLAQRSGSAPSWRAVSRVAEKLGKHHEAQRALVRSRAAAEPAIGAD